MSKRLNQKPKNIILLGVPQLTDLCFVLHLLCLDIRTGWGEGLQQLGDPGPGALSLGTEVITLALQGALGVCLLLQPGLQLFVALYQVVAVLQEALCPDALSAHWGQQLGERPSSAAVTWKARQIGLYGTFSQWRFTSDKKTSVRHLDDMQGNEKKRHVKKICFALWFMKRLRAGLVHLRHAIKQSRVKNSLYQEKAFFFFFWYFIFAALICRSAPISE